jgi:hypothetical protein
MRGATKPNQTKPTKLQKMIFFEKKTQMHTEHHASGACDNNHAGRVL